MEEIPAWIGPILLSCEEVIQKDPMAAMALHSRLTINNKWVISRWAMTRRIILRCTDNRSKSRVPTVLRALHREGLKWDQLNRRPHLPRRVLAERQVYQMQTHRLEDAVWAKEEMFCHHRLQYQSKIAHNNEFYLNK